MGLPVGMAGGGGKRWRGSAGRSAGPHCRALAHVGVLPCKEEPLAPPTQARSFFFLVFFPLLNKTKGAPLPPTRPADRARGWLKPRDTARAMSESVRALEVMSMWSPVLGEPRPWLCALVFNVQPENETVSLTTPRGGRAGLDFGPPGDPEGEVAVIFMDSYRG